MDDRGGGWRRKREAYEELGNGVPVP